MTKIVIAKKYNAYWSFYYYSNLLTDSLRKKGLDVTLLDFDEDVDQLEESVKEFDSKLFITFVRIVRRSIDDALQNRNHRWLYWRVDPIEWIKDDMVRHKNYFTGTVDQFESDYAKTILFPENVQFLPHAVDPNLTYNPNDSRPYDVTFLGSSYDVQTIERKIAKVKPEGAKFIYDCIEKYTSDDTTIISYLLKGLDPSLRPSYHLLIDAYVRAKERYDMLNAIEDAEIHVFGGTGFDTKEFPVRGWGQIFRDKSNVIVHPAVTFPESINIMRQSKIVLNSMPFFKNGTHERVFNSLALGAVPVTSKNLWFDKHFVDGKELIFYDKSMINDQINTLLNDDKLRQEIVQRGGEKVMRDHTFDNRADQIINWMKL